MSQRDIEFSTGANHDSAAREVDNAIRAKIATFSCTIASGTASSHEEKRDFVATIEIWYNKLCCRNAARS
jgi:hypothetical protein